MSRFRNLGDLIPRGADLRKLAIIEFDGQSKPRTFSYSDIDSMSAAVARALTERGLKRGNRVAILSANSAEFVAVYFGIMRAGLVAAPVNFKFPRSTIDFIVRDCDAKLIFCDAARRADCPAGVPAVMFGASGPESFGNFVAHGEFETVNPDTNEPAMFLYTSGSTGIPKGVVLSHASHIWVVESRLKEQDTSQHRFLIAAPLYHMNALALTKLAIAGHATIVLLPQFAAVNYIKAIGEFRCTWLTAVPPMIAMMLREQELLARTDLSSVKSVRLGSAPVSAKLMEALHRALPNAKVTNAYGTTEAGPVVFGPHPAGLPQPEDSVGYPHREVQLRLVAGHNLSVTEGELEMKSPAVMLGYHNRPDVPSPITNDGFYRTGDVFRRDQNGFYYFAGRTDDMFVSGGENIFPTDLERTLEKHPKIAQAAVVPIDDDLKGQKPVAFIIPKDGQRLAENEIKQFALANAPAYQHPRFVWTVDHFPLASTNKIDRAELRKMAKERVKSSNER